MYIRRLFYTVLMLLTFGQAVAQFRSDSDSLQYISLIDSSFLMGNQGKYAEAESYLSRAIRIEPKLPSNIYLLNNLAALQQLQGKIDAAILSYSSALERLPEEQTIRLNRARLFALSGKHQAAITDYSLLVSQAPRNELYLYQRAMSYMLNKAYELAEADLSRIIELNDQSLKARLGYALLKTAQTRYDEAERLFDYLVSKLNKSPEVYEGRARLYHARGMRGFALRDVEKAFELSGRNISPTLYRLRANIKRSMGEDKSAQADDALAKEQEKHYLLSQ